MKPLHGLIFGVFDKLHAGHDFFISEAIKKVSELTIVVAPDTFVITTKHKSPTDSQDKRIQKLRETYSAVQVVLGDEENDSWKVLALYTPDIIFLGYDQHVLKEHLIEYIEKNNLVTRIEIIGPYHDDTLHSSTLN